MSAEVHGCSPDASLVEAAHVMRDHQVRRLPAITQDGKLVGMVSLADLVRGGIDAQVLSETLAAIGKPRSHGVRVAAQ